MRNAKQGNDLKLTQGKKTLLQIIVSSYSLLGGKHDRKGKNVRLLEEAKQCVSSSRYGVGVCSSRDMLPVPHLSPLQSTEPIFLSISCYSSHFTPRLLSTLFLQGRSYNGRQKH